ncbi:MAG: GNAT family N-acetyltransferase [Eubacteriales bacterium]|nr:GNAT family N-acetyltransferase [Eubacteriales bacterium]
MTIETLTDQIPLWNRVMDAAGGCSWSAGPALAAQMQKGQFTGWERVFAALNDGDVAGFCTLAKTDCVDGLPYTPYIGYVFVGEPYRGKRLSQQMIAHALAYAKTAGFETVYLVSGEQGLYEKYGFIKLEERKDRFGRDQQIFRIGV